MTTKRTIKKIKGILKYRILKVISEQNYLYSPDLAYHNLLGTLATNSSNTIYNKFDLLKPASAYLNTTNRISPLPDQLSESDLISYLDKDKFPLPTTIDREGYSSDRHFDYWVSGLKDYLFIKEILYHYGIELSPAFPILDIGCASGRVLRHFVFQEKSLDLWGTDINGNHIEWIRRYLPSSLKVFQNTILPNLPIRDNSMSLVYAFSVFTHIDEFEMGWLAELNRMLKPGGIAYITVLSESSWNCFNPENNDFEQYKYLVDSWVGLDTGIQGSKVTYEFFKQPMPGEKIIMRAIDSNIYNKVVFHSNEYISKEWGRFLKVLEIIPKGHSFQDVVLLQKL